MKMQDKLKAHGVVPAPAGVIPMRGTYDLDEMRSPRTSGGDPVYMRGNLVALA